MKFDTLKVLALLTAAVERALAFKASAINFLTADLVVGLILEVSSTIFCFPLYISHLLFSQPSILKVPPYFQSQMSRKKDTFQYHELYQKWVECFLPLPSKKLQFAQPLLLPAS